MVTMGRQAKWAAAAAATLTLCYVAVFALADRGPWQPIVIAALANAAPAVLIGWLVAARIAPIMWPPRGLATIGGVLATLIGYALATYVTTIILLALANGGDTRSGGLFIQYFTGPAFVWQSFQGLAYGLIALLIGWTLLSAQAVADALSQAAMAGSVTPAPLGRLLLRTDQGIVPVEAEDVIRIHAADDYCEVILSAVRHLARMSMGDCKRLLANEPMLRVHRSHIVNLRQLVNAETTGDGRLQLTLSNGDRVTTSRAGARLIREHSG